MKTVVFGLFDDLDNARRILLQLARSPLDMEGVSIVHADPGVQHDLAAEAAMPRRRGPVAAVVAGAVVGGALGAFVGGGALVALGPLLAAAAGILAGGAFGLWAGVTADAVKLPAVHAAAAADALAGGATVVLVRTGSQPTARAIRELFLRGGSRVLPAADPDPTDGLVAAPIGRSPNSFEGSGLPRSTGAGAPASPVESPVASPADPSHALFAPPWRRTPSSVRIPPGAARAVETTEPAVVDPTPGFTPRWPERTPRPTPPETTPPAVVDPSPGTTTNVPGPRPRSATIDPVAPATIDPAPDSSPTTTTPRLEPTPDEPAESKTAGGDSA